MSRWNITGSKKMIKTLIMLLVCMTSFHTVSPNSIKDEENKGDVNQTRTISADFGWEKNIRQLGYEEAVQFRFNSDGTVWHHYWDYDSNLIKRNGTDRYESGTYVITESNSRKIRFTITWSNGRQKSGYIDYSMHTYAELHYDMKVYEELSR